MTPTVVAAPPPPDQMSGTDKAPGTRMVERRCGAFGTDSSRRGRGMARLGENSEGRVRGADQPRARARRPRSGGESPSHAARPEHDRPAHGRLHRSPVGRRGGTAPGVPVLGARHRRSLAPRPRHPHRRRCDPPRAGPPSCDPGGRGPGFLPSAGRLAVRTVATRPVGSRKAGSPRPFALLRPDGLGLTSYARLGGTMTALITWMTPFVAFTSGTTTRDEPLR